MDNYTMTFTYDGDFDIPNDPEVRNKEVPGMILQKLEKHEFELVDFNLTQNYDSQYAKAYIKDAKVHRAVLEIKLDLSMRSLKSREAIYNCCIKAMKQEKLHLKHAYENEDRQKDIQQSIIVFDTSRSHSITA